MAGAILGRPSFFSQLITDTLKSLDEFAGSTNDESVEMTIPPKTVEDVAEAIVNYCLDKFVTAASDQGLRVPTEDDIDDIAEQISDLHGRITTTLDGEQAVKNIRTDLVWAYDEGNETIALQVFFKISIIPKGDQVAIQPSVLSVDKNCTTKVETECELPIVVLKLKVM